MLSANPTPITPPRVPMIDQRTGLIDRAWYMFFLGLFQVAQSPVDSQLAPDTASLISSYDAALIALTQEIQTRPINVDYSGIISRLDALDVAPVPLRGSTSGIPGTVSNIALTGSPFTYVNATGSAADVLVTGGGISLLEFSRGGATFYTTGSFYGMFELSPSDTLRVTYIAPIPTLTLVPR